MGNHLILIGNTHNLYFDIVILIMCLHNNLINYSFKNNNEQAQ